jgi:predicted Kef-type K+ transport protein
MDSRLEAEVAANKDKISRMFFTDSLLLLVFVVLTWIVLALVLPQVLSIVDSSGMRAFIIAVFFITLGVYTSSMLAVFFHLRRDKNEIYLDEIHAKAAMKKSN